jgi:hypothetical protein
MGKHFSHLAIALLTAGLGIACAPGNDAVNNKRPEQSGGARGVNQRISLSGCVQAAPGTNEYVLRDVAEVPPEQQPQGQERMEHAPLVARGSWVRLASGDADNLKNHLGKHVTITGEIRDAGGNTIGTAGQSSELPRAGEANGNAPQVAVEQLKETEGTCGPRPGDTGHSSGK